MSYFHMKRQYSISFPVIRAWDVFILATYLLRGTQEKKRHLAHAK